MDWIRDANAVFSDEFTVVLVVAVVVVTGIVLWFRRGK